MNFAAVEARANASVFKHLANATASFYTLSGEVQSFPVVFDAAMGFVDGIGVETLAPGFTVQWDLLPELPCDVILEIRGVEYRVRGQIQRAEGGLARVPLARQGC